MDTYVDRLIYTSFMVTTKQKPIANTGKIIRQVSKHNTTESHHTTREESKKRKGQEEKNYQTARKQLRKDNKYILIYNYFKGNSLIKRYSVAEGKKKNKTHIFAAHK